jgi:hypothetical protein
VGARSVKNELSETSQELRRHASHQDARTARVVRGNLAQLDWKLTEWGAAGC